MYLGQLMKSDYEVGVDGPKIIFKNKLAKMYENVKHIHGKYGVLMNEAQMNDSRMNQHALFTASIDGFIPGMKGANIANYVELVSYVKNADGKIEGAVLYDKIAKKEFKVKGKVVVNCAGVHADELRTKDDPAAFPRIIGAKGTHLMLKQGILPNDSGIIIPKTKDGRLIFVINYLGHTMAGTTDEKTPITHLVAPD
jgi:glycerol-3-phosphate dehydrogenase